MEIESCKLVVLKIPFNYDKKYLENTLYKYNLKFRKINNIFLVFVSKSNIDNLIDYLNANNLLFDY